MKLITGLLLLLSSVSINAQLTGYVRDNYTIPVSNARIHFINEQDTSLKYTAIADINGYYRVSLTSSPSAINKTELLN